ncbi:glutathione peroxidase [Thecamonas trahens ATCC 50062]|uniref:Glutathione peroxidase n=1 Tax=Thecamonas trahens ATCC 50062 TaxID=461836 RepID=A0A0L0D6N6_THETB|nr:glutathione peroxidase [Thecamonas trahens ATCC 50062]KNC46968.1 glutathione peroxidase [Thecamonas trahens ATCC 50062]|eukprot:XP_013760239.1 glutathione peroxidase [Thecamonas trahens ATCC 50062]
MGSRQSVPDAESIYDFTVKDIHGEEISLATYKDTVLLITNLVTLHEKLRDRNFNILAFPCNQFGGQEPGTNEEILEFVARYNVQFPLFDKIDVNGSNAAPLYRYLKAQSSTLFMTRVKWNFETFVVDADGHVVSRHLPTVSPLSLEDDIVRLLDERDARDTADNN